MEISVMSVNEGWVFPKTSYQAHYFIRPDETHTASQLCGASSRIMIMNPKWRTDIKEDFKCKKCVALEKGRNG
jgi:hypothetical protein